MTVPAEAKTIADRLLCKAQEAALRRKSIPHDRFVAVVGIHDILLDYGRKTAALSLAQDIVVLGVAEVLARENQEYLHLLNRITEVADAFSQKRY